MRHRKCSCLISSSELAHSSPHSLLMVKQCFSVEKAATPNRRTALGKPVSKVALKLPRAADICTKASSSRSVKSAFAQGTRTGSGRSGMRNAQPQKRLGESSLATLERTGRSAFTQTQAAATAASTGLRSWPSPQSLTCCEQVHSHSWQRRGGCATITYWQAPMSLHLPSQLIESRTL